MQGFVFAERPGRTLLGIANREGTRQRTGTRIRYPAPLPQSHEVVEFINASGEDLVEGSVVRLIDPTEDDDGNLIVNVDLVDSTYRWRYLVLGADCDDGKRGWGTWAPVRTRVLYDTGSTPSVGEHWGPKDGEVKLFQHRPGFIVDGTYDADNGWLWAKQEVPAEVRVKNSSGSDIAAASSGTVNLLGGSGRATDLGLTLTANNDMSVAFKNTKVGSCANLAGGVNVVTWQQ